MKQNALSKLCGMCCCFFSTLTENLILCSSAEAGFFLNLFLNFEQKPRVLVIVKLLYHQKRVNKLIDKDILEEESDDILQ